MPTEASKAKTNETCTHCWHVSGASMSTCMTINNTGWTACTCCRCGEFKRRTWHEEERTIEGHGPHTTHTVRVYDDVTLADVVAEMVPE